MQTDLDRRTIKHLVETIQDEIRIMCDTNDLAELDTMAHHAIKHLYILQGLRYCDMKGEDK